MSLRPILAVVAALGSGCALTNYTISDPYTHADQASAPQTPSEIVLRHVKVTPTLQAQSQAVGVKKNGYGIDTAYVFVKPEPAEWLRQAATLELERTGAKVVPDPASAPTIDLVVDQFFVEPDVGFWGADLTAVTVVDVQITIPNTNQRFARRFVGEVATFEFVWTDGDFESNLVESAQRALSEMSAEIGILLAKTHGGNRV